MNGVQTLFCKEILRFWKVATQTITAPILTSILYLLIFGHIFKNNIQVYSGMLNTGFLIPGLVMMSILQNSFANSSSSLIQSKITGNLIFVLLTPLTHWELFNGYVFAAAIRGLIVGFGIFITTIWFTKLTFIAPWWIIIFALLSAVTLGVMGLIAGIWAEKFDQLAAFQNFLIVPLTFLAGVFYSIHSLPPFWQIISRFNPFFYMIDGFRCGFFGYSDVDPLISLSIVVISLIILSIIAIRMLQSGYKLRVGMH